MTPLSRQFETREQLIQEIGVERQQVLKKQTTQWIVNVIDSLIYAAWDMVQKRSRYR